MTRPRFDRTRALGARLGLADRVAERCLQLTALSALALLVLITVFIFREGTPLLVQVGPARFLLGSEWRPDAGRFGILPMVAGTLAVTAGAMAIGLPLALSTAIVLAEVAPRRAREALHRLVELLAGLPPVVYGFLGATLLPPWIRAHLGGPGWSVLAGALVLAVMILPTVIAVAVDALEAVPEAWREGSTALGATRVQTLRKVVLPAARPGLVAAVLLGVGRAVGETMAVLMVMGNAARAPTSILDPARTLTAHIALEMGGASGDHARALFAAAVVLFVVMMGLGALVYLARFPGAADDTGFTALLRRLLGVDRPPGGAP